MKIKGNDRVFFAGQTGSGKTMLAQKLTLGIPRLIVIDSKANMTRWGIKIPTKRTWKDFVQGYGGRLRIVPPIVDDQFAWLEGLFERLYHLGNLTLYIDEANAVVPPGQRPGKWLHGLYTRGRELGIGVWCASQRPMSIPLIMISESDWLFVFRLNMEEDRKRLAAIAGPEIMTPVQHEHGVYMYKVGDPGGPHYFRSSVLKTRTGV